MATTDVELPVAPDAPASTSVTRPARGTRMSTVFIFGFALAGLDIGMRQLGDNSFMWHLRTGQYILDHGIPYHDPYSFSAAGTKWVAQSWLAELIYGLINGSALGGFGLRLFGGVVGAVVGASLFVIAWRISGDRVRSLGLASLSFMVVLVIWSERPLMLGLLGMLAVVWIVELPDSWLSRRPMISLPIVMWLWTNVHGTWTIGFAYLGLHLVGRWLDGAPPSGGRERVLLRASVLAGAVTLINPYFLDLVLFPLRLMGRASVLYGVQEWQSPSFHDLGGKFFALFVVVTLVLLARKRPSWRDIIIAAAFLVLGFWAVRNVGLTAVAILPILARASRREKPVRDDRSSLNTMLAGLLVAVTVIAVAQAAAEPNWDLKAYPVKAVAALEAQHLIGRHLFTTDGWGGYLIATEYPRQRVFYDDRYDMYPIPINEAYDDIANLHPNWQAQLDKYGIDVIMWSPTGGLTQALAAQPDRWTRVYVDKTAAVYVRRPPASLP
jgi:hypothetical protein